MWVNPSSISTKINGIFSTVNFGLMQGYALTIKKGTFQFYSSALGGWQNTGFRPAANNWYHLAVTRQGTTLTLYVNGHEEFSRGCSKALNSSGTGLVLGRLYTNWAGSDFAGHINNITVCKGLARWTADFTPPDNPSIDQDSDEDGISDYDEINGTFGYVTDFLNPDTDGDGISDYDEINGSYGTDPTLADTDGDGVSDYVEINESGTSPTDPNDRPDTLASASVLSVDAGSEGTTVFTDASSAAHAITTNGDAHSGDSTLFSGSPVICFDGDGDYLATAASTDWNFGQEDFSIDVWVNLSDIPAGTGGIVSTLNFGLMQGYALAVKKGTFQFYSPAVGGWKDTHVSAELGQWYHLTVARKDTTLTVYVDGQAELTAACGTALSSSGTGLVLGRLYTNGAGSDFTGHMDHITVCNGFARWIDDFTPAGSPPSPDLSFTLMETSDIHDHASGYGPYLDYTPDGAATDTVKGGYARMAHKIREIETAQDIAGIGTLLVDDGDWYMGTTYDATFAASDPVALKFFQAMGYDVVNLGNHEFDWGPQGLAGILSYGAAHGFTVPVIASNMQTNGNVYMDGMIAGGIIGNKQILTLNTGVSSIKVGLIGLMGPNADQDAPAAKPVTFNHNYTYIQSLVNDLVNNDGVDLVIALSHGGLNSDGVTGDDADLANHVSGIDVIASGHYHTADTQAREIGDSLVISPGSYGRWVGRLDATYNPISDKIVGYTYNLIPIDDSIPGDSDINTIVATANGELNGILTAALTGTPLAGMQLDTVLTSTSFDLEESPFTVTGIGSLCADSLRNVANGIVVDSGFGTAGYGFGTLFDIGVVASGVIRDGLYTGTPAGSNGAITFSDLYNMLPLGISPYDPSVPGYPLMSVYATGADVYAMCEAGLSLSQVMGASDYYLNFSGLKIVYDTTPSKIVGFSAVQAVYAYDPTDASCTGTSTFINPYDPGTLYHIVVDLYALQMLNVVQGYGFPIAPKDAAGNVLNLNDLSVGGVVDGLRIDSQAAPGVQELKEWMAPVLYVPAFGGAIPGVLYDTGGLATGDLRVQYLPPAP